MFSTISFQHYLRLQKTSSRRFQDVFKTSSRRLDQDEYIHLTHTSSENVFKTSCPDVLQKRLPDIFKTSC